MSVRAKRGRAADDVVIPGADGHKPTALLAVCSASRSRATVRAKIDVAAVILTADACRGAKDVPRGTRRSDRLREVMREDAEPLADVEPIVTLFELAEDALAVKYS